MDLPYNQKYVIMGKDFVNSTNVNEISSDIIPKHVVFFYNEIKLVPNKVFHNWHKLNPDYKIIFFSFEDAAYFLNVKFSNEYKNHFNKITSAPHKCDFFRLCFIYIYGGIYSDIDNVPLQPISEFINPHKNIKFLSCLSNSKKSFAQAIIMSIKESYYIKVCIDRYINEFSKIINSKNYSGAGLSGTLIMHDEIKKIFIKNNYIKENQLFLSHKEYAFSDRYISTNKPFINTLLLLDEFTPDGKWWNCHMRNGYNTVLKCRYDDYPWFPDSKFKNNNYETFF